jgi:hypothetical protein
MPYPRWPGHGWSGDASTSGSVEGELGGCLVLWRLDEALLRSRWRCSADR